MASFDWKGLVGTVAPMLGTALGGPVGGLAVRAISSALLGKEDGSESEVALALQSASPDALLKLKDADNKFAVDMEQLGVDIYKIDAESQDSARKMQMSVKSIVVPTLAIITVGGFFAVIGFVLTGKVPLDSTVTGMVIGAVGSKAEQIYNFYFGSSAGSKQKTSLLAKD